ncbi:Cupredoxin [Dipodascopsis tothii]|uniref:Cupredoxin n=1 Tax=Dipodascopsis tothii TaxID=44089 RepID=UPI0034CD4DCF
MRFQTLSALAFLGLAAAKTRNYDFSIDKMTVAPDGYERSNSIGVNGVWPPPPIIVDKGDQIVINMTNNLGDENTSLHFHGMFQNGTNGMDGPNYVTQCPIPPNSTVVYNFTANQSGSYWYHSHTSLQYPAGLRAPLIINDPEDPYLDMYDEDLYLTVSDWYHDDMQVLKASFLNLANPTGAEPIPDHNLLNDTVGLKWAVEAGKTYRVRIINIGAFVSQYIWFEGHTMTIIEVDGVNVEPAETDMIYITAAQRYSVLITAKNDTSANYPFVASFDTDMLDTMPDTLNINATAWVSYNSSADYPDAEILDEFDPYDDFYLVPYEKEAVLDPDYTITVDVVMDNLRDGVNYAFFNNITYVAPKVPTLYSVLGSGDYANDTTIYGEYTHPFVLDHGDVIEIVINNQDTGKHPFHLHGHTFQVVERSNASDSDTDFITYDASNPGIEQEYPMRRDVAFVRGNGYMVLRFVADNPGVWFFHCHIDWHLAQGLALTLIEAPKQLQEQVIPDDFINACKAGGFSYEGNAAGTTDWLDLTSQNKAPGTIAAGFTARGIVALVFSCVSAFVGMGFIAWYGSTELKATEAEVAEYLHEPLEPDTIHEQN